MIWQKHDIYLIPFILIAKKNTWSVSVCKLLDSTNWTVKIIERSGRKEADSDIIGLSWRVVDSTALNFSRHDSGDDSDDAEEFRLGYFRQPVSPQGMYLSNNFLPWYF